MCKNRIYISSNRCYIYFSHSVGIFLRHIKCLFSWKSSIHDKVKVVLTLFGLSNSFVFFPSCTMYLLTLFGWFLNGKCIGINFWWLIFEHGNIGLVDVSWKKRPQRADVAHSSTGMSRDDGLGHAGEWWSHVGPKHGGHKISAWREGGCRSLVVWYVRPGLRTKKVSESVFLKLSRGEGKVQEHMKFWNPNDS